jgi:predicted RNase H-like HicB family nuclease
MRSLLCFAEGKEGDWEAICLDLDIAVQGSSYEEVSELLNSAIATYFEDALAEDAETRKRLLSRKAPFPTRVAAVIKFLFGALAVRGPQSRLTHGYTVPCAA